jgi:NADH:ubiquinone oxidoreductase subunit F (NADH-binding)
MTVPNAEAIQDWIKRICQPSRQEGKDRMKIDDLIESISGGLPEGWRVRLEIENGAATVTAIRPDGSEVPIDDDEQEVEGLLREALHLALDEREADKTFP